MSKESEGEAPKEVPKAAPAPRKFLTKAEIEKKKAQQRAKAEKERKKREQERLEKERKNEVDETEGMTKADRDAKAMLRKLEVEREEAKVFGREEKEKAAEIERSKVKFARWNEKNIAAVEWRHYLERTTQFDASKPSDVNTFMSTWRDRENLTLEEVMEMDKAAREIITDMECLEAESLQASKNDLAVRYRESMVAVKRFAISKIEETVAGIVLHADIFMEPDSEVCILQNSAGATRLGVWVTFGVSPNSVGNPGHVVFDKVGLEADLPAHLAMKGTAMMMLMSTFTIHDSGVQEGAVDVLPLGGEIMFDLLALPHVPVKVKTWTIRQISAASGSLVRVPYGGSAAQGTGQEGSIMLPVRVTIPPTLLVREPAVARWSDATKKWETAGIVGLQYSPDTRVLAFQTPQTGSFTLVQPINVDFPYKSWEMRSMDTTKTVISVVTKTSLKVSIQVTDDSCTLLLPDVPELSHLRKASMPALLFLKRLGESGIILAPPDRLYDVQGGVFRCKSRPSEERAYKQIAEVAPLADVAWSKWNSTIANTAAAVLTRPRSQSGDGPWVTALLHRSGCSIVTATEETFIPESIPGTTSHLDLRACIKAHVAKSLGEPAVNQLFKPPELQFCNEVFALLSIMRPLSFSS